jgi:3-phosphoshikimate 1-carboxyvinyltransferase
VEICEDGIRTSCSSLRPFNFDATECPDLFPPLVSLAAHCEGDSTIQGVSRLAHKESNRALVLQTEFAKLGVVIDLDGDVMTVHGGIVKGGKMHANNDHRIAMAGAVAALKAESAVEIENPECVAKSYPGFWNDLEMIMRS